MDHGAGPEPARGTEQTDADLRLAHLVAYRLLVDDEVRYRGLAIAVQNRVVILTGQADAAATEAAGAIARGCPGVLDVCNLVDVPDGRIPADRERFDEIVAGLLTQRSGAGRARALTAAAVFTVVVWSLLLGATVRYGWAGVGVVAAASLILLGLLYLLFFRRRTRR